MGRNTICFKLTDDFCQILFCIIALINMNMCIKLKIAPHNSNIFFMTDISSDSVFSLKWSNAFLPKTHVQTSICTVLKKTFSVTCKSALIAVCWSGTFSLWWLTCGSGTLQGQMEVHPLDSPHQDVNSPHLNFAVMTFLLCLLYLFSPFSDLSF